jgi:hypothetical protein
MDTPKRTRILLPIRYLFGIIFGGLYTTNGGGVVIYLVAAHRGGSAVEEFGFGGSKEFSPPWPN